MKKTLCTIMTLLLLLLQIPLCTVSVGAETADVALNVGEATGNPGDKVSVLLKAEYSCEVWSMVIGGFAYDENALTLEDFEIAPSIQDITNVFLDVGMITINVLDNKNPIPAEWDGTIGSMKFSVNSDATPGEYVIDFQTFRADGAESTELSTEINPGKVVIEDDAEPHEHTYGDWNKNDENHWHECTDAECPDKESSIKDMAEHVYANDADEECDVCGYVREIEQPHEHTYSEDWSYDETYHWHAATCEHDVVADKGEHIDADSDGKCDVCGYEVEPEQPHKHTFSTAWSYDEAYHWHKSTCGHDDIVADKAAHTASAWIVDREATYRNAGRMHKECVTCGYILETAVIPASDPSQAPWWGITNRPETTRKYTLTATAGNGGSITNEGTYTILTGLDLTYTITPMRGYAIESVFVDGRDMGAITEYTFRNVKANHTISATFRKSFENPFIDIFESDRYYDAVAFVYENELFKGVSAREFAPDTTMTRAMFVTVLGRLANVNADMYNTVSFDDVEAGSWYAPYVQWACDAGIVNGYGDGKFGVNDPVTVEQAAVLLARFAAYTGIQTANDMDLSRFTDIAMVSNWAVAPMQFVVGNGIYTGTANALEPQSPAKRSLLAEMLYAYVMHFGE